MEIICADDGSTDGTLEILREYEKNNKCFHVLKQENKGPGPARNMALNHSIGEFIAFMDSDDWYPDTDILETLYDKAVQNRVNICGGSLCECRDGKFQEVFYGIYQKYTFLQEGIMSYRQYQFDFAFYRFIYRRDFLIKNKIFFPDYRRFEDPHFFVKAMISAEVFYAVPKITYCYRVGHHEIQWDPHKINGSMRGLIDNLVLSRNNNLALLHKITVDRLNDNYYLGLISSGLSYDNWELIGLLLEANAQVDLGLLKEADSEHSNENVFILKAIKNLLSKETEIYLKLQIDSILSSWTYKIGRIVTFIPRAVLRFIQRI